MQSVKILIIKIILTLVSSKFCNHTGGRLYFSGVEFGILNKPNTKYVDFFINHTIGRFSYTKICYYALRSGTPSIISNETIVFNDITREEQYLLVKFLKRNNVIVSVLHGRISSDKFLRSADIIFTKTRLCRDKILNSPIVLCKKVLVSGSAKLHNESAWHHGYMKPGPYSFFHLSRDVAIHSRLVKIDRNIVVHVHPTAQLFSSYIVVYNFLAKVFLFRSKVQLQSRRVIYISSPTIYIQEYEGKNKGIRWIGHFPVSKLLAGINEK